MSRIARTAHVAIRRRVEIDGHSVVELAAAHGCTTATIYRILAAQRHEAATCSGDEAPLNKYAWVQTRLCDQSTETLIAALGRLQDRFDRSMKFLRLATDLPDQDDAEAQQQWQTATMGLQFSRADGLRGHMRMALALAREIQSKTAELQRRCEAEATATGYR